jgi:hypothetical protein
MCYGSFRRFFFTITSDEFSRIASPVLLAHSSCGLVMTLVLAPSDSHSQAYPGIENPRLFPVRQTHYGFTLGGFATLSRTSKIALRPFGLAVSRSRCLARDVSCKSLAVPVVSGGAVSFQRLVCLRAPSWAALWFGLRPCAFPHLYSYHAVPARAVELPRLLWWTRELFPSPLSQSRGSL